MNSWSSRALNLKFTFVKDKERVNTDSDDTLSLPRQLVLFWDILYQNSVNMYKEEELISLFYAKCFFYFLGITYIL